MIGLTSYPFRPLKYEILGLKLMLLPDGGEEQVEESRKLITLLLIFAWTVITISLTINAIAAVEPPFYGAFTALIFLVIGRMWGVRVEQLFRRGQ